MCPGCGVEVDTLHHRLWACRETGEDRRKIFKNDFARTVEKKAREEEDKEHPLFTRVLFEKPGTASGQARKEPRR